MRARTFLKYLRHPSFIFRKENPDEVVIQRYIKKIYNPDSFASKPRFRKTIGARETREIEIAIKRVYNPKMEK